MSGVGYTESPMHPEEKPITERVKRKTRGTVSHSSVPPSTLRPCLDRSTVESASAGFLCLSSSMDLQHLLLTFQP